MQSAAFRSLRLLGEDLFDFVFSQVDLMHRVAALVEWHVVVVAPRREEDFGIPDEALSGRQVRDLMVPCERLPCSTALRRREPREGKVTSRMGPSGSSPILMVVHSCLANAEPETCKPIRTRGNVCKLGPRQRRTNSTGSAAGRAAASASQKPETACLATTRTNSGSSSRTTATRRTRPRPPADGPAQGW